MRLKTAYQERKSISSLEVSLWQCQTVVRIALKSPSNETVKSLWKNNSRQTNVQYDQYRNTKEITKSFRNENEDILSNIFVSQGVFFPNTKIYSLSSLQETWPSFQINLPKSIFNFTLKNIANALPTIYNLAK